ncbi:MAG: CBS domain-containing protein [Thermoleophilia bacterium]|nr:CBS domain-containing protein [Thermoleophilia bacterium]
MTASPSLLEIPTIITTHQNADFDALAAAVGASLLYPDSRIVFTGSLNPNVREFVSLYGEALPIANLRLIDQNKIKRLVVVDTADPERIGELGRLWGQRGIETIVFDHHPGESAETPPVQADSWVVSSDGAQATSMLHILYERGIPVGRLEATIFALGIHEDTGSLTYPRTTIRDAEMLALAMRLGASQALIERFLHSSLTGEQRALLMELVDAVRVERVGGLDVHVVAREISGYVDGLSVIAHKLMELLNAEVLLQAIGMEGRVFVTARSRSGSVDVAGLLRGIGGGGHAQAASAVVKDLSPETVIARLLETLSGSRVGTPTAAEIMSRPVRFVDADTPVTEALLTAQRYGHSGICVRANGRLVGVVARRDLDKAIRHGLGHAPVKGVMTRKIHFAKASTGLDELRRIMVEHNIGRVPIVKDEAYEEAVARGTVRTSDVIGIATRTDVLAAYQGRWEQERAEVSGPHIYVAEALTEHPVFGQLFRVCSALSEDFPGVYLVGGFVRDLLLGQPNVDVDIAVEGDGIEFATRLAAQLGGRVRPHYKFKTAVVLLPPSVLGEAALSLRSSSEPFHVDVATTRTEFYDHPAALPKVEHASLRQDLFRRDFTINAMAISLRGEDFGTVIDFFGGYRDLQEGVIRVLHNLSFIEDPTRIFRAVRYENRYGFRMDEQTRTFAKTCVDMHLVRGLSGVRLRDELVALLSEEDISFTLSRLYELGVAREVHPKLATGPKTARLVRDLDSIVAELGLESEVVRWRLRLAAITRNMEHDELYVWLEDLKVRRSDSAVVRDSVILAPALAASLGREDMDEWEVFKTLRRAPAESLVFALGVTENQTARERIRAYLTDLRYRSLSVTGDDLIALGMKKGPQVGRMLEKLRELRVRGIINGREAELEAARQLMEKQS